MKKRLLKFIFVSTSLLLAGCAYAFLNQRFGFSIPCMFNKITGLKCPGCGVTRMCLSILHFDFKSAFYHNPAIFCMLPIGVTLMISGAVKYIKHGRYKVSDAENILMIIMIIVLLLFGIIRNIFRF